VGHTAAKMSDIDIIKNEALQPDTRPYFAVYKRYYAEYRYRCDTVDDALSFLKSGEDEGSLSMVAVLQGDDVLYNNADLINMVISSIWPWNDDDDEK
jgi:hypothetical protein